MSFTIPPISGRQARNSIFATVLFGPIGRHVLLTTVGTWRGWSMKPAWFWRPFTAASLLFAAAGAIGWPWLGGEGLYRREFGDSTQAPNPMIYPALCFLVWSAVLLPHTVARLLFLIWTRSVENRCEG